LGGVIGATFFCINKTTSKNSKFKIFKNLIFLESILPLRDCFKKSFGPSMIKFENVFAMDIGMYRIKTHLAKTDGEDTTISGSFS
jgi:hypothetical protein